MDQSNLLKAETYYKAIGEKNVSSIEHLIHPDIQFIAPLAKVSGKENFLEAARRFTAFFNTLKIRSKFGTDDQAMIVYDLDCPNPIGVFSTAVLMTFKEGLVSKIELFFDARPFETKT